MKISFKFDQPATHIQSTGIIPGGHTDDLTFTFTATSVRASDPKEVEELFRNFDVAVAKFKESAKKWK
jgi:hypothetical protein